MQPTTLDLPTRQTATKYVGQMQLIHHFVGGYGFYWCYFCCSCVAFYCFVVGDHGDHVFLFACTKLENLEKQKPVKAGDPFVSPGLSGSRIAICERKIEGFYSAPGGPTRPQELPRSLRIAQHMKFNENHRNYRNFHGF